VHAVLRACPLPLADESLDSRSASPPFIMMYVRRAICRHQQAVEKPSCGTILR
jgi:hypothetical protein